MVEAGPEPAPERTPLRRRLSLLLLLLIVFGAPTIVTTSLVTQELVGDVTRGDQPGGVVRGTLVDEAGDPVASHAVTLWLLPADGEPVAGPVATSDAEGAFGLVAPPVVGFYELRAGGELLQLATRRLSFLDPRGDPIEPRPVTLELRAGAVLELDFVRADGSPAPGGTYAFDGEQRGGGFLLGLLPLSARGRGRFEAGRLRLDGLPPMDADLAVEFDSGETARLELAIAPGLNATRIELDPRE